MTYLGFNFQCLKTKLDMTRARVIQSCDYNPQKPLREISVRRGTRNISLSLNTDCRSLKHKEKTEPKTQEGGNLNDLFRF